MHKHQAGAAGIASETGMSQEVLSDHQDVAFYRSLNVALHKQDIDDLERHYQRRESLYRQLGIPPAAVRAGRAIEFGPGSGFNALYTASLKPASFTLVDAVPQCITEMHELFEKHEVRDGINVVESLIEDVDVEPNYDLVLAEGVVCHQRDPAALALRISRFSKPLGIVVLTCSDAASIMGEIGRRLIAHRLALTEPTLDGRMTVLRRLFAPHLATLSGMSRSVEDWILDNVIRPVGGAKLFSIRDAITAVDSTCDVYGSAPHFLTDWRWYKQITGVDRKFNERAIRMYERSILNLLDYRFEHPPHSVELGRAILAECSACYELLEQAEAEKDVWLEVAARLDALVLLVSPYQAETAAALASLRRFLGSANVHELEFGAFGPYFGRGMQYLSFLRRASI